MNTHPMAHAALERTGDAVRLAFEALDAYEAFALEDGRRERLTRDERGKEAEHV